ncbi:DUF397 domain-containing protein [Streptomyces sp. CA-111067]|uniref:DUF397 domain-containing protein n=1 Tax=Streptomyces sp. CA-111067 TaxID=3240046 RepID=UPI003D99B50D
MTHADRPEAPDWTSSSYSQSNGGECVEWAPTHAAATGEFLVRDSKDPNGPVLAFPADAFASFVAGVKAREFPTV